MTAQDHRTKIWQVDMAKIHAQGAEYFLLGIVDPSRRILLASDVIQGVDGHEIVQAFERFVLKHGAPRTLLVDGSVVFQAAEIRQWAERHGAQIVHSGARAPSTNGSVERLLKSIADNVRIPVRLRRR